MIELKYYSIPLIGFFIGSFTNYLAIKLMFHPRKKTFGIMGFIPKRRHILAKKISEISPTIIPENLKKFLDVPFIGDFAMKSLKDSIEKQINNLSLDELEKLIMHVMNKEMKFLIWIGGILGFIIGLIQLIIIFYL